MVSVRWPQSIAVETIFDELSDAVLICDTRRRVVCANPAVERVFGYRPEELLGKKTVMLFADKAEFKRQGRLRLKLEPLGERGAYTIDYCRKDGTSFPGETVLGALRSSDAAVIGYLGIIRDISERVAAEQALLAARKQLEQLALTDELTGIANRRHFTSVAHFQFAQAARYRMPLSLIIIDIDHFKRINDRFGHEAGDRVLQALCEACRPLIRQSDLLGRIGGEEFAILLPHTGRRAAFTLGKRLNMVFPNIALDYGEARLAFTASLGIATLGKADTNVEALMRRADRALYSAKQGGRDQAIAA